MHKNVFRIFAFYTCFHTPISQIQFRILYVVRFCIFALRILYVPSGASRLTSKMCPISASNKCVCMPKMRLVASASVTPGHA